jgi:hypothetical protein
MALRSFSLIGGIGALLLFIPIAKYFLKPWAVLVAVGILALGEPFIYHATEAKQYGTELFASMLALYLFLKFQHSQKLFSLLLWGVVGGLLVWFSYSSIFVLAGLAFVLSSNLLLRKEWKSFFLKLIPFTSWLCSFALVYYFFLSKYQDSGWLKNFFDKMYLAYMPMPPSSFKDVVWFPYTYYMLLERNLGLLVKFGDHIKHYSFGQTFFRMPFLPLLLVIVGVIALFRKNKYYFCLLVFPILLTLLASGFKLYPFYERFILFLAPMFIILIAYGAERFVAVFDQHKRKIVAPIVLLLLLFPLVWNAVRFTTNPNNLYKKEYNREAAIYVNDRFRPGDAVYYYWNMVHVYKYYKDAYNLKYTAIQGTDFKHLAANKEEYY